MQPQQGMMTTTMIPGSPPVAPAVPPQARSQPQQASPPSETMSPMVDEVSHQITHGAMMGREPPVPAAAAAAAAGQSIAMPECGVSQTTKHELHGHKSRLDSHPTTFVQPGAVVTPHDPSPCPSLPAKSLKREHAASSKPTPAAKERAKRVCMEDTNKAERHAAVVEAFLSESGDRRPAVCPEKFRSGSVRQRVATRQLRILQKLRVDARAGGQPLPDDLVRQELAEAQAANAAEEEARIKVEEEAAVAKAAKQEARVKAEQEAAAAKAAEEEGVAARSAKQDVFLHAAEPSLTSNALDTPTGFVDSEPDEKAMGELASSHCGTKEENPLPGPSMTSQCDSEKAERGTQQQLGALGAADARNGDPGGRAPHDDASTQAILPTEDVQSSQISDEQAILDGPHCAAIGSQQACCDVNETDGGGNTPALEPLGSVEVAPELPKRLARVLYDWTGGEDGDLNLNRGMVVTITDELPGHGWWSGTVDDEVGIFPRCFVSPLLHASTTQRIWC